MQGTGRVRVSASNPASLHSWGKAKRGGGRSLVADKRHHVNVRIDRRLPSTDALADHRLD
jgi:hypothetical protein